MKRNLKLQVAARNGFTAKVGVAIVSVSLLALAQSGVAAAMRDERLVIIGQTYAGSDGMTLIGAFSPARGWLASDRTASRVRGSVAFKTVTMHGRVRSASTRGRPRESEIGGSYSLRLRSPAAGDGIALSGIENPLPRRARRLTDLTLARRLVIIALADRQMAIAQPNVTEAFQVDLDGDGQEEFLIAAQSTEAEIEANGATYALAVVGHWVSGRLHYRTLHAYVAGAGHQDRWEEAQRIDEQKPFLAIADFDNDGALEIVLQKQESCGLCFEVWSFKGETPQRVFQSWWGG